MTATLPTIQPLDVFTCPLEGVNLIEASAGTGKTWTICGLYLRLLLERELTVQQILVVTFTNAATAELRERIRTRIHELLTFLNGRLPGNDPPPGNGPPSGTGPPPGAPDLFIDKLAHDLMLRPGVTRQELTARLDLALHSFDEAAIFTIHGFCQRALADNPFAAGLPMRSELVQSDRDLLLETVYDFWRRHVAQDATPEFARYITARKDSPDKYARLLERHLAKPLARHLWPSDIADPPLTAAQLHQAYRTARTHWLAHNADIQALLKAALSQLNANTYNPDSVQDAAAHWDTLCREDDPLAEVGGKARLFRDTLLAGRTKKKCVTPSHAFFADAEAYLSQREALEHSMFLARCRLLERLFAEGAANLRSIKRSRQVVAFNDMLANVHERLQHPDYPWLAASIRTRFPAALIDEFQDTDPLQLAIFQKIYDTDDSRVFLVGDPKQAIYSFRHADLHSYLRAAHWAGRRWTLTGNQRSSKPLLEGLNHLFGRNGAAFILPEVQYRKVEFGPKPRAPFLDASEPRAPLQVWRLPDAGGARPKAGARRAAVDATAAEIARLLRAGQDGRITLDDRALRPGDIAVLVRSRALGAEVKLTLAGLQVGAVELSRDSIFGSAEARDWETVLTAIASPTRDALLRTALATEIFGRDASEIERITAGDTLLPVWILQFMEYRDLWVNRGFGVMFRQLFTDQSIAAHLLARPDGERRLTNCLHVGEELQQAAQSHSSPEALLRWLKAAREDDNPVDSAQLRLESDQNLVQIVTIHSCKGLEYPIVFCPFLCDGGTRFGPPGPEGYEYHEALQPVIDFSDYDDKDPALAAIKTQIKLESAAETVRLIYVALTRAVHRCYLVVGPYDTPRSKAESARSMLNWLVAGGGSAEAWFKSEFTTQQLNAAWAAVAAASGGALVIDALPANPGLPVRLASNEDAGLTTPTPPGPIAAGWRFSSYSGLSHGARSESSAGDHDARTFGPPTSTTAATLAAPPPPAATLAAPTTPIASTTPVALTTPAATPHQTTRPTQSAVTADLPNDDILRFPRGAEAGVCIHAVFEHIDFTDRSRWQATIAAALASHPQSSAGDPTPIAASASAPTLTLARMLWRLVEQVTTTTLIPGLQLDSIPLDRRLTEFEFDLPVPHLSAADLNARLDEFGYEVPSLTFGALEGYLKGFIDLIFEHRGQYFILDWKSNHLGYAATDYGIAPLDRAMADNGYHLQYLLYVIALDRYLKLRVPDYRYDTHFGGVLYLFVRGVRPEWSASDTTAAGDAEAGVPATGDSTTGNPAPGDPAANHVPGVYFHRPTAQTVRVLDHLLGSP